MFTTLSLADCRSVLEQVSVCRGSIKLEMSSDVKLQLVVEASKRPDLTISWQLTKHKVTNTTSFQSVKCSVLIQHGRTMKSWDHLASWEVEVFAGQTGKGCICWLKQISSFEIVSNAMQCSAASCCCCWIFQSLQWDWLICSSRCPQVHTCPSRNASCTSNTLLRRHGKLCTMCWMQIGAAMMASLLHCLWGCFRSTPSKTCCPLSHLEHCPNSMDCAIIIRRPSRDSSLVTVVDLSLPAGGCWLLCDLCIDHHQNHSTPVFITQTDLNMHSSAKCTPSVHP